MPRTWSKRTSVSATTKRLSGRPAPVVGQRHGRLQPGGVVVAEVADDRLSRSASASSNESRREPQPTNE